MKKLVVGLMALLLVVGVGTSVFAKDFDLTVVANVNTVANEVGDVYVEGDANDVSLTQAVAVENVVFTDVADTEGDDWFIVYNQTDASNTLGDVVVAGDKNVVAVDQSIGIKNYVNAYPECCKVECECKAATPATGDAMSVMALVSLAVTGLGGAFVAKKAA